MLLLSPCNTRPKMLWIFMALEIVTINTRTPLPFVCSVRLQILFPKEAPKCLLCGCLLKLILCQLRALLLEGPFPSRCAKGTNIKQVNTSIFASSPVCVIPCKLPTVSKLLLGLFPVPNALFSVHCLTGKTTCPHADHEMCVYRSGCFLLMTRSCNSTPLLWSQLRSARVLPTRGPFCTVVPKMMQKTGKMAH